MAATPSVTAEPFTIRPCHRKQVVLQRLMHDFEYFAGDDVEESESDLMVQLSGMITRDEFTDE